MMELRTVTTQTKELESDSKMPGLDDLEIELYDLDSEIRSITVLRDTFTVNDLLNRYSYLIARSATQCQLTFVLTDGRQINVRIETTDDIARSAYRIASKLARSGNRLLQLALTPASRGVC